MKRPWFTYMLKCADGTLYIGVALDTPQRVAAHNAGKGAKYTLGRRPVKLLWQEKHSSQPKAMRREIELKKLSRSKKEELIRSK